MIAIAATLLSRGFSDASGPPLGTRWRGMGGRGGVEGRVIASCEALGVPLALSYMSVT